MKKLTALAALIFMFNLTLAQNDYQKELFTPEVVMKYQSKINLSEKQRSNIKDIHKNLSATFSNLKWDLSAEKETLNDLLKSSKINKKASLAQMEKVTALENQLKKMQLELLVNVKNELSEDQQKQLKELRTSSDIKPVNIITGVNDNQKIKFQVSKNSGEDYPVFIIKEKGKERQENKYYLEKIDPNRIESVNVIKGKAATVQYGEKGKNGVVVIKMKDKM